MSYWVKILAMFGLNAILAMSLNVICGLTGLLQLGHVGFYLIGAYAAGLLALYLNAAALGPANLLLGCTAGVLAAAAFAALLATLCLRLRGDYLAIATLGFGEIVRLVLNKVLFPPTPLDPSEWIGGATGIRLPHPVHYASATWTADYASCPVILAAAAVTWWLMLNLKRSYLGRAMLCVREDEIAARVMGIHVPRVKVLAFLIGASFAGLAGALLAYNPYYGVNVKPNDFDFLRSIDILLIVVLGGLGSVTGSLLAAAILVALPELLRFAPEIAGVNLAEHKQLLYALLLIVLIRLMPNGILGLHERPAWLRLRSPKP